MAERPGTTCAYPHRMNSCKSQTLTPWTVPKHLRQNARLSCPNSIETGIKSESFVSSVKWQFAQNPLTNSYNSCSTNTKYLKSIIKASSCKICRAFDLQFSSSLYHLFSSKLSQDGLSLANCDSSEVKCSAQLLLAASATKDLSS